MWCVPYVRTRLLIYIYFDRTEDGYILELHRIPPSRKVWNGTHGGYRKTVGRGRPVFFQHGVFSSSVCWLLNPSHRSLGIFFLQLISGLSNYSLQFSFTLRVWPDFQSKLYKFSTDSAIKICAGKLSIFIFSNFIPFFSQVILKNYRALVHWKNWMICGFLSLFLWMN